VLGFVWTYNRIIPTKFFVTSGKATDPISSLNAFDAALAVELASSYAISPRIGVDPLRDFFAISREGRDFINERVRRAKTSFLEGAKEAGFALARSRVSLCVGMDMIDR